MGQIGVDHWTEGGIAMDSVGLLFKVFLTVILSLICALAICAYCYIDFQGWLRNLLEYSEYFKIPAWLRKLYRELRPGRRYVLLGAGLTFLSCVSVSLIVLIWQPILELALPLLLISLAISCLGAATLASTLWAADRRRKWFGWLHCWRSRSKEDGG